MSFHQYITESKKEALEEIMAIYLKKLSIERGREMTMEQVREEYNAMQMMDRAKSLDYRREKPDYEKYKKEIESSLTNAEIKDWNELC